MTAGAADRNVSAVLRAVMGARRQTQDDVAAVLGITRPAVSARLAGVTRWTVGEVAALADHFGMGVADFVEPGAHLGLVVNQESVGARPRRVGPTGPRVRRTTRGQ